MITLYHLENSRSLRILWLLEELGLDYDLKSHQRDPETMLGPDSQKAVHPQGTFPVIVDGGVTLAESGAITEYLIHKAGAEDWRPPAGDANWTDYLYWLHYAEATLQPLSLMSLVFSRMPDRAPGLVRPILKKAAETMQESFLAPRASAQLAMIDAHLKGREWFAGDHPTGADVMMIFPLETTHARFDAVSSFTNIMAYLRRVHARPAYLKALSIGGRYDFAPLK